MLIQTTAAQAPAAAAATNGFGGMGIITFLPYLLIFAIMYFLLLRPQQQRMKAQQAKIAGVQRNDQVVTAGGIVGKVVSVEDAYATIEIAPSVRVRVVKATLADVVDQTTRAAND